VDRLIAGRYELLGRLGSGGAATVYRARDVRLDRIVAVKVLHEQLAADPDFLARFQREARTAASLNHPNVVDVYDYGAEGNTAYIVMPFVGGGNLKELIAARGRLAPTEATDIARQVLSALAAAHAKGLVHRDVKPQNVLLTGDGVVKLADFGIAHVAAQPELTQVGTTIGTAAYIAPEQATGASVGPAADLYGVGLLLYEMLTGRPPFVGGTPMEVAYRQVNEHPTSPRQLVPAVPAALDAVVMRALAKDPAARFPSAEAMLAALDAPIPAPSSEVTQPMVTVRMPVTPPPGRAGSAPPVEGGRGGAGLIVVLAIVGLLAALGMAAALTASRFGFLSGGGPPGSPAPTSTPPARPTATAAPIVVAALPSPTATATATPTPTPTQPPPTPTATRPPPSATATATATSTNTPAPSPTPTSLLRPVVTPTPTLSPPVPVATPKPGAKPNQGTVEIPDTAFQGGYRNANGAPYRGQSATWVYGARTPYSTMTATFELPTTPREAQVRIVGLDSEGPQRTNVEMLIDDRPVFRGPAPFPDDVPSRPQAPWAERTLELPAGYLREGPNTITIRNLEDTANMGPPFLAVHQVTVVYRS